METPTHAPGTSSTAQAALDVRPTGLTGQDALHVAITAVVCSSLWVFGPWDAGELTALTLLALVELGTSAMLRRVRERNVALRTASIALPVLLVAGASAVAPELLLPVLMIQLMTTVRVSFQHGLWPGIAVAAVASLASVTVTASHGLLTGPLLQVHLLYPPVALGIPVMLHLQTRERTELLQRLRRVDTALVAYERLAAATDPPSALRATTVQLLDRATVTCVTADAAELPDAARAALAAGRTEVEATSMIVPVRGGGTAYVVTATLPHVPTPSDVVVADVWRERVGAVVDRTAVVADAVAARTALEEAARLREEVIATVLHDLRSPLTAVLGAVTTVQTQLGGRAITAEQQRMLLDIAIRNTRRVEGFAKQLSTFAELGRDMQSLVVGPLDVAGMLRQLVHDLRVQHPDIVLELDVPVALGAMAEPEAVHRVVGNLVGNAAKYGPEDGAVTVRAARVGDVVRIEVDDEGDGVPEGDRDQLFEAFWRREVDQGTVPGSGLGLAIVARLTAAMGGTCGFDTTETGGGRAWVELRAADLRRPPAGTTTTSVPVAQITSVAATG